MRLCTLLSAVTLLSGWTSAYFDGYANVTSAFTPLQVRLAYASGNGQNGMMVSWNTFAQLSSPTVMYGLSPAYLNLKATSDVSVTYPTSLTYNNHVNLTGLLPATTYYYLPEYSNVTTPYNFTTSRLPGDGTPYTAALVVDMGTFGALGLSDHVGKGAANPLTLHEQTTLASMVGQMQTFDFLLHAGDIAYADYWLKEEVQLYLPNTSIANGYKVYEAILNAFYDEMMPITSVKPYMVNPGNHEANCDNGGTTDKINNIKYTASICSTGQTNFTGYRNHFRMPSGPSAGLENFWYSYDNGMVHYVHIDTETDLGHNLTGPDEGSPEFAGPFGLHDQQLDWLAKDLGNVDRSKTPWVIVLGHRPFYLSAASEICTNCTRAFEPLFLKYGVDLYLSGHSHLFERMAPVYNSTIDPNELNNPTYTWYITNGAAGHYDGLDTFDATFQPYDRAHEDTDYAWSKLTFHNCTHMTVDTLFSANSTIFDSATLFKNRTCSFLPHAAPAPTHPSGPVFPATTGSVSSAWWTWPFGDEGPPGARATQSGASQVGGWKA